MHTIKISKQQLKQLIQEEFIKQMKTDMNEGGEVDTIFMFDAVKEHVDETINAFNVADSELYELMKMSEEIKLEFPDLSQEIVLTVEPLMQVMQLYPKQLRQLLNKFGRK
jgi:hypothetical protein